jgi:double-stranded uracil-DNA glycosylase
VSEAPWKPTRQQVEAALGQTIPDVLGPGLDVVFCGINPSLYSAAVQHHFARPGNRFWPALHGGGFTERLLSPFEDKTLPARGLGITNLVDRATANAAEVDAEEFLVGGKKLRERLETYRPRAIAFLGISAYRTAFAIPQAALGRQPDLLAGTVAWVLPNPSGLNAHYQLVHLARLFAELRLEIARLPNPSPLRKSTS